MDFQFSEPALGTPVLADTEFAARLKRGFDFAGGNGSVGNTHVWGFIRRGTPVGRRLADDLSRPYGVLRNTTVDDGTQRINFLAGSRIERLFYVGDVVAIVDTSGAAWATTAVVLRIVTAVSAAGQWIDVDGAALADATESGHMVILESLMTNGGVSSPVTELAPPEGVMISTDMSSFDVPTDLDANGQLVPRVRNNAVAWGSHVKAHLIPGVLGDGPVTEMEYLLNPGAIPSGSQVVADIGEVPPDDDGILRFPQVYFDRFAVQV